MAGTSIDSNELCLRRFSRRHFLKLAVAGCWLVGCRSAQTPNHTPTIAPGDTLAQEVANLSPAEQVTIRFAHHNTEDYETLIQAFNKDYPHITIDLISGSCHDVLINLRKDEVDVRLICWFDTVSDLQRQDDILPLDSFMAQDESFERFDFYPATLETFNIAGETWAIPFGVNPVVLYYNRDLFEQYGVPYPNINWTLDDFLDSAKVIRDPDAGIFGYVSNTGCWDALVFVYRHNGTLFDDINNPTRTMFDDSLTIEALLWYAELYHEHNVAPSPSQVRGFGSAGDTEWRAIERAIWDSKMGMWAEEYFHKGGRIRNTAWPMQWGLAAFPQSVTGIEDLGSFGLAISSQTKYPEAAWQWLAFLSRQMFDYMMPVRRSIAESTQYEQLVGSETAAVTRIILENGVPSYLPRNPQFEGALGIFEEAIEAIKSGELSVEEAMHQAQLEAETRFGL